MVVVDHPRKEKCSEFSKFEAYIMTLNSLSNSLSLALCNEAIERTLWWLLITAVDTVSRVEVVDNSLSSLLSLEDLERTTSFETSLAKEDGSTRSVILETPAVRPYRTLGKALAIEEGAVWSLNGFQSRSS